jgi:hypothetical protein
MQHLQVTHGKGLLYECDPCNAKFEGMEQMRDHLKKFHSYTKRGITEKREHNSE